jgi:hypothetical protein
MLKLKLDFCKIEHLKNTMKQAVNICLSLIAAVYLLVSINVNFGKNKWQDVLESDAWGYYAYLPAVFIYHDLHFNFYQKIMQEGYFEERLAYEYRVGNDGKVANKYFCGTALAISPFYLGAHCISAILGYPQDGYNRIYILSVNIAAIFYTILGLFFLSKILNFYTNKQWSLLIVLLAMAFGTQLFYYSFGEPGMSHVYSFCFVNLFLWKIKNWFENRGENDLLIAAFALGIVFLIRPFNILILLIIPFMAGNWYNLKARFIFYFNNKQLLLKSMAVFISIASIQSVFYYRQTGHLWVDSYPGEDFNFLKPHVVEILFSFKKGLFVYTPLVLMAHLSLYYIWKQSRYMVLSYVLFFSILTYMMSSWWIWYYGGSFSLRAYIEYFGVFAILLVILLNQIKFYKLHVAFIFFFIALCQIQTYQYRYFVIHWSEMNQEKYFDSLKQIFSS